MTEQTPLIFTYALLRRDRDGAVKTLRIYEQYSEALYKRDYLRALAKKKDSTARFYVKMVVEEKQNASA